MNAAAVGAHLVGGAGLLIANRGRAAQQAGVGSNTVVKLVLTGAAVATTAYSGVLGGKVAEGDGQQVAGATEPTAATSGDVAGAQTQLRVLQWVTPVLTGLIIVLGAQQGEQQRPTEVLSGLAATRGRRSRR